MGRLEPRPVLAAAVVLLASGGAFPGDCGTPYDCAVLQVGRHEFPVAVRALERLLETSPGDLKALNLLGIALTGAGRIDDANARFREALMLDPAFVPARKNLAINELGGGRLEEAERHLKAVLERAPDDEIAHVHLGEIHFAREEPRAALPHYEKGGGRVALNPLWLLHHATCLLREGPKERALQLLARLPADAAEARFQAGLALGRAGAHAEAARFFGTARRGHQDPYAAGYNQTLMLIEAGDPAAAVAVAEELFEQGMKRAELYNLASRAYLETGRLQDAYDALRTATRLEPAVEGNYVDLATICMDHENYDLGLEVLDVGLHHRPESWLLHMQRGVVLAMKAELGAAEKEFETARSVAPDQPAPYAALAMAWMQTGQTQKAVEVLREEARRRSTADPVVSYVLALALLRSGLDPAGPEAGEAVDALRASIRVNPEFAPARTELGRLLLKRDDADGAARELEKAVSLDPQSTASLYNLAQAYREKGERERAAELLARVSRLNARERGDDPDAELKRVVVRLVREGKAPSAAGPRPSPPEGEPAAEPTSPAPAGAEPRSAEAHLREGVALDGAGRTLEAVGAYEEAVRLDPGLVEARYGLALACARLGDREGAIRLLRDVVKAAPTLAGARYDLAVHLWERYRTATGPREPKDLDEAERELEAAVRLDPGQPRLHLALGQLLAERESLDAALASLRGALELSRNDPGHAYDLGLALRLKGDLAGAEAQLRAALAGNPKHADARRALGLILRQTGELEAAAVELRLAVAERPGDAQAHNVLGTVLARLNDVDGAFEAFRTAARLEPELAEARVNLGQALSKAGRREEARAEVAEVERIRARKAARGRALVLLEAAEDNLEQGRLEAALERLREAASASPDFAWAHYRLGVALRQARAPADEVQAAFLRVLELEPDHARARHEIGLLLASKGDLDGGAYQLRRAAALRPSLLEARLALARLAAASGDWTAAASELRGVLAWEPENARARYDLAVALKATGDAGEAERELAAARRLDPRLPHFR